MSNKTSAHSLAALVLSVVLLAFSAAWPALLPSVALAAEVTASAESTFTYQHDPVYNPRAMRDVVVNPDAIYGFSPNPDSGSIAGVYRL